MFSDAIMCAHGHYKSPVCLLNMPYIKEVCLTKMQRKFTSNTNFVEIIRPLIKYTNHDTNMSWKCILHVYVCQIDLTSHKTCIRLYYGVSLLNSVTGFASTSPFTLNIWRYFNMVVDIINLLSIYLFILPRDLEKVRVLQLQRKALTVPKLAPNSKVCLFVCVDIVKRRFQYSNITATCTCVKTSG